MESLVNAEEAQAALASMDRSRSDLAGQLVSPWRYHSVLGILTGGMGYEHAAGLRKRRNLAVWMSLGLFGAGNYAAVVVGFDPWAVSIAVGVVVAAFTVVWGRRFDKAMQAQLRESA